MGKFGSISLGSKITIIFYFVFQLLSLYEYILKIRLYTENLHALWLIYIAGDGPRYRLEPGFLSYTETGSRDLSLGLCNVNMFGIVQCSHQIWNPNLSPYPSLVSININEPLNLKYAFLT